MNEPQATGRIATRIVWLVEFVDEDGVTSLEEQASVWTFDKITIITEAGQTIDPPIFQFNPVEFA